MRLTLRLLMLALTCAPAVMAQEKTAGLETLVPGSAVPYLAAARNWYATASRAGAVSFFTAAQGAPVAQITLAEGIEGAPVATEDRLAVPLHGGGVALLSAPDGAAVARIASSAGGAILSTVPGGILMADPAGALTLIDTHSGAQRWRAQLASTPSAPATQCGAQILAGTAQGGIVAVAPDDGRVLWSDPLGGPITTAVTCDGKRAWAGSSDNQLHAFKPGRKGLNRIWAFRTGGDVIGRPLVYHDTLFFCSYDTYLYALGARNGHLAWKTRLGRRPQAENLLMGDLLLVAPLNAERLEIFRATDGKHAGSYALTAGVERLVTPPVALGTHFLIGIAKYGEEASRIALWDPRDLLTPPAAGASAAR